MSATATAVPTVLLTAARQASYDHGWDGNKLGFGHLALIFEGSGTGIWHYRIRVMHPDAQTPFDLDVVITEVPQP